MKKMIAMILLVTCLALGFTACSSEGDKSDIGDTITETEKEPVTENAAVQVTPTSEPETELKEESPEPEVMDENKTSDGVDRDNPPVNWGTPDGPQIAVENYYADTVFELVSMEVLEASREYVKFTVVTKKGGVLVDPDRTIELQYEDGAWKVINEGY